MRFLGARVVLTPAHLRGTGMMAKVVELAQKHGWFICRQFENEANADIHSRTTAPEILEAFAGERLDYWVTGYGTGGTLKGVGRVLRERSPETQIIVCEADNSPVLASGIPNPRNADGTSGSHPMSRPHPVQGWGPDFIPKLTEDAVAMKLIDRIVPVNGAEGLRLSRELARQEGIFVGISSGATLAGALEVCRTAARRLDGAVHAARYRRAVSQHAAVRRHRCGHERRGAGDLAIHAERAFRCAGACADAGAACATRASACAAARAHSRRQALRR